MSKSLLIQGGRVVDPSQNVDKNCDVLVADGKIKAVGSVPASKDFETVDAKGCIVTPGWVDIHTHLREPGELQKESIQSGSRAAAAGGFTSIACMANTKPTNDSAFITNYIYQKVAVESAINVYAIGAITKGLKGEELAEIGLMAQAGIVGISDDGKTLMNAYLMRKAMDYSKRFDLVVISHAEDAHLKGKGVMNEGFNSSRFGLRGIPRTSEELIVARDIMLAELTGAKLHIAHVSSAGSVALVREAKQKGIKVTAEVTPHHLTLTDEVVGTYDTNTKVAPPLREAEDVQALCEALSDGTIDVVACDHAPHAAEDKEIEYDFAEFGMIGLETAFPIYYRLVLEKKISLTRLIEALTVKPSGIIGIPKGTLKVGADADITIFNPDHKFKIDKQGFRSKSRNSPFHGWDVVGCAVQTFVAGKRVFHHSEPEDR